MAQPTPLCPRCDGWAFEPGVTPMKVCGDCHGTGAPRGVSTGRRQIEAGARG